MIAAFTWLPIDTQIVAVAAVSAVACALPGTFLVLRRMSMMGDAISHAVLPGLAAAFLLTGSRSSAVMLIGAGVVGVLTAVFVEWIRRAGQVDEGASMGVVFTVLFAGGLILLQRYAHNVDLDPDCVLYGAIETTPLDLVSVGGIETPRALLTVGAVLALNVVFVVACFKELRISTFDPALAATQGVSARLMHYALMTLVAVTTVASFESVGSVLVIAMLIVPPAAAHLLTDRLGPMLLISAALAAASAVAGHLAAIAGPPLLGLGDVSANTAGMMSVAAGAFFVVAMLAGPRHGLVSRAAAGARLSLRIAREDVLGLLYRAEEAAPDVAHNGLHRDELLRRLVATGPVAARLALARLARQRKLWRRGSAYGLAESGRQAATDLVKSHRLWETYLEANLAIPPDHTHPSAERLEHVTDDALRERLAASLGRPARDPQGKLIPPAPHPNTPPGPTPTA